jgi:hypothetical protein
MLQQRRSELSELRKQRAGMERDIAKLDRRIELLGGGKARGRRGRNSQSLTAIMEDVLTKSGKPMPVGDIMDKVLSSGYRTSSANFRGIVNQTLIKDKRFSSAGRGLYQMKK